MSRPLTWNNLDQKEKESWLNQLGQEGGEPAEYLSIAGGTLTGTLTTNGLMTGLSGAVLNGATTANLLTLQHTNLAGVSYAPVKIVASTASQVFMHFSGAVMSTASIIVTAANIAGVVAVRYDGQGGPGIGYLPFFKYV